MWQKRKKSELYKRFFSINKKHVEGGRIYKDRVARGELELDWDSTGIELEPPLMARTISNCGSFQDLSLECDPVTTAPTELFLPFPTISQRVLPSNFVSGT